MFSIPSLGSHSSLGSHPPLCSHSSLHSHPSLASVPALHSPLHIPASIPFHPPHHHSHSHYLFWPQKSRSTIVPNYRLPYFQRTFREQPPRKNILTTISLSTSLTTTLTTTLTTHSPTHLPSHSPTHPPSHLPSQPPPNPPPSNPPTLSISPFIHHPTHNPTPSLHSTSTFHHHHPHRRSVDTPDKSLRQCLPPQPGLHPPAALASASPSCNVIIMLEKQSGTKLPHSKYRRRLHGTSVRSTERFLPGKNLSTPARCHRCRRARIANNSMSSHGHPDISGSNSLRAQTCACMGNTVRVEVASGAPNLKRRVASHPRPVLAAAPPLRATTSSLRHGSHP